MNEESIVFISDYQKQYTNKGALIDPTAVTFLGAGLNLLATGMMFFDSTRDVAPAVYSLSVACDKIDGSLAEFWGLRTLEGAKIDPLIDKSNLLIPLLYFVPELVENEHYLALGLLVVNNGYNYLSQRFRGEILPQIKETIYTARNLKNQTLSAKNSNMAGLEGKLKAGFQAGTIIGLSIASAGWLDSVKDLVTPELFNQGFYEVLVPLSLGIAAYCADQNIQTQEVKKGFDKTLGAVRYDLTNLAFKIGNVGRSLGF